MRSIVPSTLIFVAVSSLLSAAQQPLGSRSDVAFRSYPTLNHLFIAGTGRSVPAEYQVAGHVADELVRDIASWILTKR